MSIDLFPPIPTSTANAAESVFAGSNFYLSTGNQMNKIFAGLCLGEYSSVGHESAIMLAMLYTITTFQYIESLPDSLAAEALRTRVDWKYALHLPLSYQGLAVTSFCQFRKWLVAEEARMEVFQALLFRFSAILVITKGQRLSLNTLNAVETVCLLSRLEVVRSTFSQVFRLLAGRQPEWLGRISLPHWYDRYGGLHRPSISSMGNDDRLELAQSIGADGFYLQNTISSAPLPGVDAFPEVAALKRVWQEQYRQVGEGVLWRKDACAGCPLSSISIVEPL